MQDKSKVLSLINTITNIIVIVAILKRIFKK